MESGEASVLLQNVVSFITDDPSSYGRLYLITLYSI